MMRWTVLEKTFLGAFLFWFACGLIFTLGGISADNAAAWPLPGWLHVFVALCLRWGDPLLIFLAFANTHLLASRQWGAALARRWAVIILALSFAIETCGALTGFPFGHYAYTTHFGPELGVVPLAIPLAWQVVLTNALFLVRTLAPHAPRLAEAAGVGLIATLYDSVLEPFATRVKFYWEWNDHNAVPLQNYAAWFVIGTLLVLAFAPTSASRAGRDVRPALILGATIALFLAGTFRP
jgi:uncharacterized membrane protein